MSTPPIPPNVAEIAAPLMLGALWNWTLYGVLIVQLYVYSYNFPGDRALLKLLDHLVDPYLSPFDVPIIGSIVSLIVQFFFVYRIWILSGRSSWCLCLIICLSSTVDAAAAFYGGVYGHVRKKFASGWMLKVLALTWLSGNTLSDILIAGSMLFHLVRRRREGNFSDHALSRIVRLTIETNILTTAVGIISLLMVALYPDKPWFTCPTAVLGKLYSNTLLVSLNNRISIRDRRRTVVKSPPLTFALTTNSQHASEILHADMKPSLAAMSVTGSLKDSAGRDIDRVINIA
ncbi:hypothetical protein BJY52DRAFT_943117 [Lactarius psammicola]|nr:hypothetical protein BJY52DRAFT_943117 [Lactarius psammicola]